MLLMYLHVIGLLVIGLFVIGLFVIGLPTRRCVIHPVRSEEHQLRSIARLGFPEFSGDEINADQILLVGNFHYAGSTM